MKKVFCSSVLAAGLMLSIGAQAALECDFVSSSEERLDSGFLFTTTAKFICDGKTRIFAGSNWFGSCKPQFVLSEFVQKLAPNEHVSFQLGTQTLSSLDGTTKDVTMVVSAVSATGKTLEPQTIIQHGKPRQCNPTQVVVD